MDARSGGWPGSVGIMDAPVIAVRGEATREVPPELAHFSVAVAARDPDRQTTLRHLAERAGALRTVLDEYADAIDKRETGGLHVRPESKRRGEKVRTYHGSVSTTVTVKDFDVLGDMMLRLADADQITISGPWWSLRPDSPAHREARRAAVADAMVRAREYAEAVGAQVGRLLEVSDIGADARPVGRMMAFAASASAEAAPQLDLDPQQQTVYAQVAMRFTMTEPAALG